MLLKIRRTAFVIFASISTSIAAEPDAVIHIHAQKTIARVSPYTTGACIEDVNHEIYGGLYSQMVFGESFQEPAPVAAPPGFTAYAGRWQVSNGEVLAAAGEGPKLIHDKSRIADGTVSVEIQFADNKSGNAGLILRVDRPGVGADRFTGYEIALHPDTGTLLLGRHRENWEPIRTVPCPIPVNEWIPLSVGLKGRTVKVSVSGKKILEFEDHDHPLPEGHIGLRTWQREARFRNLTVAKDDHSEKITFPEPAATEDEVSGSWRAFHQGDVAGKLALDNHGFVGTQSQRITFGSGNGELGVINRGLNQWGMSFLAQRPYEGVCWVKAEQLSVIHVALESNSGDDVLAHQELSVKAAIMDFSAFNIITLFFGFQQ